VSQGKPHKSPVGSLNPSQRREQLVEVVRHGLDFPLGGGMMKSCRTPSGLTEYSSITPERMKRTRLFSTETVPVLGSPCAPGPKAPLGAACL
jgi:hypothetical protein